MRLQTGVSQAIGAYISILGSLFVMITYLKYKSLRRHPGSLLFGMASFSFGFHVVFLVEYYVIDTSINCCHVAPFSQYFLLGHELYLLMLGMDLLLATRYPFAVEHRQIVRYHTIVQVISLISAVILYSSGEKGVSSLGYCWLESPYESGQWEDQLAYALLLVPMVFTYVFITFAYVKAEKLLRRGLPECWDVRKHALQQLKAYIVVFVAYWIIVSAGFVAVRIAGVYEDNTAKSILRLMIGLKGMLNCVLWFWTNQFYKVHRPEMQGNLWDIRMKEESVNWALRKEIIYLAATGIQKSASRDGPSNDSTEKVCFRLNGKLDEKTSIQFHDLKWSSFHKIRKLSNISSQSYIESMNDLPMEQFSIGKSEAFMYFTANGRFLIKTCTKSEQSYLLKILPQYIDHLEKNPNSFICRYVGCHQLVLYGRIIRLVVMQSIFHSRMDIHESFDLKGSWVGRQHIPSRKGATCICTYCGEYFMIGHTKSDCCCNPNPSHNHVENSCGKDGNWKTNALQFPPQLAHDIDAKLHIDSQFLASIGSMDYSLLLGIHYPTIVKSKPNIVTLSMPQPHNLQSSESEDPYSIYQTRWTFSENDENRHSNRTNYLSNPERSSSISTPTNNGIRAITNTTNIHAIAHLGIIDILTQWGCQKKLEHLFKVYIARQTPQGISCVDPNSYAQRFQSHVIHRVATSTE